MLHSADGADLAAGIDKCFPAGRAHGIFYEQIPLHVYGNCARAEKRGDLDQILLLTLTWLFRSPKTVHPRLEQDWLSVVSVV